MSITSRQVFEPCAAVLIVNLNHRVEHVLGGSCERGGLPFEQT